MTKTGETTAAAGPGGAGVQHKTTVTNTNTGQSKTVSSGAGHDGNTVYADHNGNVYSNSGSGWRQHTASGAQSVSNPPASVQNESQARSQGEERANSFKQSGGGSSSMASHPSGGSGGWGGRSGGSFNGGGRRR